jgi:hypothetical protein
MFAASRTTIGIASVLAASALSAACGVVLPAPRDDTSAVEGASEEEPTTTKGATLPAPSGTDAGDAGVGVQDPSPSGPLPAPPRIYAVFVSSERWFSNELGGVAGADQKCTNLANGGAFPLRGKKWAAWLSDGNVSARARLGATPGPWLLLDGSTVADSVADLVGPSPLKSAIDLDELALWRDGDVWTGTLGDGGADGSKTCQGWQSTSGHARIGSITAAKPSWTARSDIECDGSEQWQQSGYGGFQSWTNAKPELRLYCFEID